MLPAEFSLFTLNHYSILRSPDLPTESHKSGVICMHHHDSYTITLAPEPLQRVLLEPLPTDIECSASLLQISMNRDNASIAIPESPTVVTSLQKLSATLNRHRGQPARQSQSALRSERPITPLQPTQPIHRGAFDRMKDP